MDFGFSDEQELLREQARDFLDRECPMTVVRGQIDTAAPGDAGLYARMAELGWTGIPVPEADGGLGLGLVDLSVVLEEIGRHIAPGPFVSAIGWAAPLLAGAARGQGSARLRGVADGSQRGTVALAERSGRWDAAGVMLPARRSADGYVVSGEKLFVPDAVGADWIVVAARTSEDAADGTSLLLVDSAAPGVEVRPLRAVDRTRRLDAVQLDEVEVPAGSVIGVPDRGWETLQGALDCAAVAISAELCGVAQRVLEMSVAYASARHQFGRPIGSFQGVSHRCADMLVLVESARSLTYNAAWALDARAPDASLAASMAKAYASDAARRVASDGIQVHGGIGFTWEHDVHLYFKRAKWGETMLGDAAYHRDRVASGLDL